MPARQQKQHGAGGGCRPLELLQAVSTRESPGHWEPGRSLGRHSLLQGLDREREKPCTLWRSKSLLFEPGETIYSKGAIPFDFPREIRDGLELSGISGQRECPSQPQVQLAPGPWHGAGGTRRAAVAARGQAVPECAQREHRSRSAAESLSAPLKLARAARSQWN